MEQPKISFTPGKEPEIVHTQHSIPAPRMVAVSLDALYMMRSSLSGYSHHSNIQTVVKQVDRLIKAAENG